MKSIYSMLFLSILTVCAANAQKIVAATSQGIAILDGNSYVLDDTISTENFSYIVSSGNKAYASTQLSGVLYFIDIPGKKITDSMSLRARKLIATSDPNIIFAAYNDVLYRINTSSKTIVDSLSLGNSIQYMTLHPTRKEIWISHAEMIDVVDFNSSLSNSSFTAGSGASDYGPIRFTKGGSIAYKGVKAKKHVLKIDVASKTILDTAAITKNLNTLDAIEVSPDSIKLYAASSTSKKMFVFNANTLIMIDSFNMLYGPTAMYKHPTRNEIWMVNHTDHKVNVLDVSSNSHNIVMNVPRFPRNMSFVTTSVDVAEIHDDEIDMVLYPNPANDELHLELPANHYYSITITDNYGKIIKQITTNKVSNSISIDELPPGLYILKVVDEANSSVISQFTKI